MAGLREALDAAARRPARSLLAIAGLLAFAALWALAAHALWHSTVPGSLHLPHVDPRSLFSRSFLARSSSYERFLAIDGLLARRRADRRAGALRAGAVSG